MTTETTQPDLLSLSSASRAFGVTPWHLEQAVKRGELHATEAQIGERVLLLLNREAVRAWKEARDAA